MNEREWTMEEKKVILIEDDPDHANLITEVPGEENIDIDISNARNFCFELNQPIHRNIWYEEYNLADKKEWKQTILSIKPGEDAGNIDLDSCLNSSWIHDDYYTPWNKSQA